MMQPNATPPAASPMRNFILICVFMLALGLMQVNWGDGLTFWGQKANSATQDFSVDEIAYAQTITSFRDTDLLPAILAKDRPTLLFIYASWCPYCRHQLPIIEQLHEASGDKVRIAILSLDKDARILARFLMAKPQPLWFKPLLLSPSHRDGFADAVHQRGSRYGSGIPHMIVFNAEGRATADFTGVTDLATLQKALQ